MLLSCTEGVVKYQLEHEKPGRLLNIFLDMSYSYETNLSRATAPSHTLAFSYLALDKSSSYDLICVDFEEYVCLGLLTCAKKLDGTLPGKTDKICTFRQWSASSCNSYTPARFWTSYSSNLMFQGFPCEMFR